MEDEQEPAHRSSARAAKQAREDLTGAVSRAGAAATADRRFQCLYFETLGLLTGMEERRIQTGQKQLSDLLYSIVDRWPVDEVDSVMFSILGDCARYGLSIEGHALDTVQRQVERRSR